MIEVDDIGKSFGEVRALDGVSFTAADGKITGLLAFFNEKVDAILVDGEAMPRPVTPWS